MKKLHLFLVLLLGVHTLFAKNISLQETVDATLASHPDAKLALHRIDTARENKSITKAASFPDLSLNAEYFPTKTLVMPSNGSFATKEHATSHLDATLTYTLWDFGRTQNRLDAANQELESSVFLSDNARALLIEKVWQAYYSLAYIQRLNNANTLSLAFYKALYEQAKQMKDTGLKTEADKERFYASWIEAQDLLETSRNEERKLLHLLSTLTGFEEGTLVIEDDFQVFSKTTLTTFSDTQWRGLLKEHNSELQALRTKIKQSQFLYEASEKEIYGTLSTVGSIGADSSLSSYNTTQIGLRATIPLFTGGKLSHQIERERVALLASQETLRSRELSLWQELYEALLDAKRLDNTIDAKKISALSLSKAVLIAKGRYTEGLATYIEVLEAQKAYDSACIAQNIAMLQKISTLAKIKRLIPEGANL